MAVTLFTASNRPLRAGWMLLVLSGGMYAAAAPPLGAQTVVSLGLEVGPTVSDFWGDSKLNPWDRAGVTAGGLVNLEFTPVWSIQGEVQYTTKGGRENTNKQPEGDVSNELYLSYIDTPILVRATLLPDASVKPVLFGGVAWSFQLSCTYDDFSNGESNQQSCSDAGFALKSTDFAVVFGGGVNIRAGKGLILIEGRGTVGLNSIDASDEFDVKNRSIALLVGYSLPINGP